MATAAVQQINPLHFGAPSSNQLRNQTASLTPVSEPHHVNTTLNFYKESEDGSPPQPTYVDRPETYDRPVLSVPVTVNDVTGRESQYTLDGNGFQFHRHTAAEKEFLDDAQIKAGYYRETEQLLKDV